VLGNPVYSFIGSTMIVEKYPSRLKASCNCVLAQDNLSQELLTQNNVLEKKSHTD